MVRQRVGVGSLIPFPPLSLSPRAYPGWQVRLAPNASARLAELRVQHGNTETGGYLYGGFDYILKQIFVVLVSDVPPGTTQSSCAIRLGPAGRTQLERNVTRRTAGKLCRVGTWHSHPRSGSAMSTKIGTPWRGFVEKDAQNGLPTLLVVTSKAGTQHTSGSKIEACIFSVVACMPRIAPPIVDYRGVP